MTEFTKDTKTSTPYILGLLFTLISMPFTLQAAYVETNGVVIIEAEDFAAQHLDEKRRWLVFSKNTLPHQYADNDDNHYHNASQGAYIELLPDTRTNHTEALARGENFSDIPGKVAVLSYPVYFATAGTYYVWARAYSSGSEDNGIHLGLNGEWPSSGQRLQLCKNRHQWTWSSAQRTKENHCGTPNTITLNVPTSGIHNVMISMREDGFELDKLLLTTNVDYRPNSIDLAATKVIPSSLPKKQMLTGITRYKKIAYAASDFNILEANANKKTANIPFYHHKTKAALAINTVNTDYRNKYAYAEYTVTKKDAGTHQLTLVALNKVDGESTYQVMLNNKIIGHFQNPETSIDYEEVYFTTPKVKLIKGDTLTIAAMAVTNSKTPENGETGLSSASGLWRALVIGTEPRK